MAEKSLKNLRVLVTAGPTREFFDPVRFLSNPSTGKMGYAIAEEAARRGAKVTLISGPTAYSSQLTAHGYSGPNWTHSSCQLSAVSSRRIKLIPVISSDDMYRAVMKEASQADLIIMTAAVSDYRPAFYSPKKIKKKGTRLKLTLLPTTDILKKLGSQKRRGQILVGFAAETDHLIQNARRKLKEKNLDFIFVNRVNRVGGDKSGFESDQNQGILLASDLWGRKQRHSPRLFKRMSKKKMAHQLLGTLLCKPLFLSK